MKLLFPKQKNSSSLNRTLLIARYSADPVREKNRPHELDRQKDHHTLRELHSCGNVCIECSMRDLI
jgi:hypothetical protein